MDERMDELTYTGEYHTTISAPTAPNQLLIDVSDPDALMDGLQRQFGGFKEIVLRLNGSDHTYKANELIDMLHDIEMEAQS